MMLHQRRCRWRIFRAHLVLFICSSLYMIWLSSRKNEVSELQSKEVRSRVGNTNSTTYSLASIWQHGPPSTTTRPKPKRFVNTHPRVVCLLDATCPLALARHQDRTVLPLTMADPTPSRDEPEEDSDCRLEPWQSRFQSNCNDFHQNSLAGLLSKQQNRLSFLGAGAWRAAWKLNQADAVVVLKTLHMRQKFEKYVFQRQINDAVATEHVRTSRLVQIYGFCGASVYNEIASRTLTDEIVDMAIPKTDTNTSWWRNTWAIRLRYAQEAAQALADLHVSDSKFPRISHGDLSPDNFLKGPDGSLKLNDFNRAKLIGTNVTSSGPCLFHRKYHNPFFSSPEEALQKELTPAVDLFALGCVLYSILTGGNYPFQYTTVRNGTEVLQSQGHAQFPEFIVASGDPVVHSMVELIQSCWRSDPTQRPSAQEVSDEMVQILTEYNDTVAKLAL